MWGRAVTFLAIVVVVLVVAAPARADGDLQEFVAFAQQHWRAPCATIAASYNMLPAPGGDDRAIGYAAIGECRIAIRPGLPVAQTCAVVVHEVGHLAGRAHQPSPFNVMYPATDHWPPCERRYGTLVYWAAEARAAAGSRFSCKFVRRAVRSVVFSCRKPHRLVRAAVDFWGGVVLTRR